MSMSPVVSVGCNALWLIPQCSQYHALHNDTATFIMLSSTIGGRCLLLVIINASYALTESLSLFRTLPNLPARDPCLQWVSVPIEHDKVRMCAGSQCSFYVLNT